jgi:hypothetical protein
MAKDKKRLKDAALVWSPKLVCKLTKNTMLTLLPTMSSKALAMLMSDGDVIHTIHLYMSFISCNYDLIGFRRYNHNHVLHKAPASFGSWEDVPSMYPSQDCIHWGSPCCHSSRNTNHVILLLITLSSMLVKEEKEVANFCHSFVDLQ